MDAGRAERAGDFLYSLPLYDTASWGGNLIAKYGHVAHVERIQRGEGALHYYIPPHEWWRTQASTTIERFLSSMSRQGGAADTAAPLLHELATDHLLGGCASSSGFVVSDRLPTRLPQQQAIAILSSAVIIELVWRGVTSFTLRDMRLLHAVADVHLRLHVAPVHSTARGLNSVTFANTAIDSATRAIKFLSRLLKDQERKAAHARAQLHEEERRRVEAADHEAAASAYHTKVADWEYRLQLARRRASAASASLWQQYERRYRAAALIQAHCRRHLAERTKNETLRRRLCLRSLRVCSRPPQEQPLQVRHNTGGGHI